MGSISSFGRGHARALWPESESNELLRLAIEVAGIGIFENDLRRKQIRFSPELCAIFGLPVGTEMPYEEAWRQVDERDRRAFEAAANGDASSAEQGKWSEVCRVLRADGAVRWVMAHGRRIYRRTAKDVQPLRSMGVVLDVTNLKESQEALQESERRLRLALDAAQMGTFEAEIGATEFVVDSQEARLLGLSKERRIVAADELRARVPLEDLRESDAKKERLQLHNEAYLHEFRVRMPDGSERWLSAHAAIRANRIFGVTCDITQRKRGEAALRESETRLRIAASGAALGIFEWDPKTDQAIWENDRMYEIFGHAREDGTPSQQQFVDRFLHPDDAAVYWVALNEALRTASNFHAICRIRQNGGLQRWIEIHGKFRRAASDEPLRLVGVIADITARKALEQEAKELCERLLTLQEEERQCIAQELHDSTTQHLVAANLNLMRLRSKFGQRSDDLELLDAIERSISEAGKEVRTFSYLMHPPLFKPLDLSRPSANTLMAMPIALNSIASSGRTPR